MGEGLSSRSEYGEDRPASRQESKKPRKPSLTKLKPGPGTAPEQVRESQRARIHRAMIDLVAEVGYPGVTVRGLLRTSGVSSRTLYAHFANVDECFASTYRAIARRAFRDLSQGMAGSPNPRQGLRAGLQLLFEQIAADPRPGRLALVDAFDAGPAMQNEMAVASRQLGRRLPFESMRGNGNPYAPLLELGVVAGVERAIRWRLLEGRESELPAMAAELCDWILSFQSLDLEELWSIGTSITPEAVQANFPINPDDSVFAKFKDVEGDRGRVLSAIAKLSLARGYWRLNTATVRREAGVSRRRFDQLFASPDECFLEATEALLRVTAEDALKFTSGTPDWQSRIARGTLAFCADLAQRPDLARLCFVDLLSPGAAGLLCRERFVSSAADVLRSWRPGRLPVATLADEAAVAAGWRIIQAELHAGRAGQLALAQIAPLLAYLPDASKAGSINTQASLRTSPFPTTLG